MDFNELKWYRAYFLANSYKVVQPKIRDVDIEKVLVTKKISFDEKTINTLLVTYIMIIKLSHHI